MKKTFGELFGGDDNMGSSEQRAILETLADHLGHGTGIPGEWDADGDVDMDEDGIHEVMCVLGDFVELAIGMQLTFLAAAENPDLKREHARNLIDTMVKLAESDAGQRALAIYDIGSGELAPDVAALQIKAIADHMGLPVTDAKVQNVFKETIFIGLSQTIEHEIDAQRRGVIVENMMRTLGQCLRPMIMREAPPVESVILGADGRPVKG